MSNLRASERNATGTLQTSILQFLSFIVVGAAGTLLHYVTLSALVLLALAPPGIASAVGACVAACVNYWLNYRFTFASTRRHRDMAPRFMAVAAAGAAVNGVIVSQLSGLGTHFLIAQAVATCLILVSNFSISKKWIFQKKK
jgi:putative flippase GtrA